MDPQKRLNKIFDAAEAKAQEEVGGLLGADFVLTSGNRLTISKEQAFDQISGKQICAQVEVAGDVTGLGCMLIGIKDAIRLGGTLIMLPPAELEEVIGREEYGEEVEDSYGEIANIITGSFTSTFEEMYPKACRLIRKELEVVVPVKVDIESDLPVINQTYYQSSIQMMLDGKQMGELILLLPASAFDLVVDNLESPDEAAPQGNVSSPETDQDVTITDKSVDAGQTPEPKAKFDVERHHKRVDRILTECQANMAGELSAFLAVDIKLTDIENRVVSKEQFFFEEASGKQILADMDVVGDVEDKSYFSIGVKDAIYLGGLLIMLPPAELENVVSEEDFSEDNQDAYGEIANIISGVYTSVFEQQYTKNVRFVKKGLQEVVPMKVEIESDSPYPDKSYYVSTMSLAVDEKKLGKVHMIFPADVLQLDTLGMDGGNDEVVNAGPSTSETAGVTSEDAPVAAEKAPTKTPAFNYEKHKKVVDKALASCSMKMAEEVGSLLGTDIQFENQDNKIISKEDFFYDEVSGKQVLANMDVAGDLEGNSYLVAELKDAIRIGGILIMLPGSELESTVANEEFSEDGQDAYGEIANIIAGVYTSVFEEQYPQNIRFIKTDLQQVAPMKVDIESNDPIPDDIYYQSKMALTIGGKQCGLLHLLLPADLFQLNPVEEKESSLEQGQSEEALQSGQSAAVADGRDPGAAPPVSAEIEKGHDDSQPVDVLLVGDDEYEAAKIIEVLGGMGYSARLLTFKDSIHNYLPGKLKAVYVVTQTVNEQSFGTAIKISSSCSIPIIAAGPEWTRTKVIKAVKYGVRDILLTPADTEDIKENINHNLLKLAA